MVLRSVPFPAVVVVVPDAGVVVVVLPGAVTVPLWVPDSVRASTTVSSCRTQPVRTAISAAPVKPIDFKKS